MYRLLENKNHLIDRLDLTSLQKEEIKAFFLKHPSYENKIDWNNKSLQYKDFESLLALDGKSKTQAKKYGLVGLVEDKDYIDFGETVLPKLNHCHLYQPLSYKGSVVLASNRVPPKRGNGAKWCISMQKNDSYWKSYTRKGIKFLFAFTNGTKYALTIYPENLNIKNEVYSFEDKNLRWPEWCESSEIVECIANLKEISKPSLAELLDKYKETLIKNPDGTIDKVGSKKVDLLDFMYNSRFICQFNKWEGDFDCSYMALASLEGAPKEVAGYFNCSHNKLISLEGSPRVVRESFYCNDNNLTSLKGAPIKVGDNFDCSHNTLTSLEGAPREIEGYFECRLNDLTSLEGAPIKVGGYFGCQWNKLASLEGAPEEVVGDFYCDDYLKEISSS